MNRNVVVAAAAGLLVGLLAGYTFGLSRGMSQATDALATMPLPAAPGVVLAPPDAPPAGAPATGMALAPPPGEAAPGAPPSFEVTQRIGMNQQVVARDPRNMAAWIQLGNDYFDTHQVAQAIDAYAKALAIEPRNPDVLTDQGVMYRDAGQTAKAIANFERASQLDPRHVQSLYNLGVVYSNDLHDRARATAAYQRVLAVAPSSPQATAARKELAALGAAPAGR